MIIMVDNIKKKPNINHWKFSKEYEMWENLKAKTKKLANRPTVYQRLKYWKTFGEAINPLKSFKRKVTNIWQECTRCWEFKEYKKFSKDTHISTWYMSKCKQCMKEIKQKYRNNPKIQEMEREYKINFRKTKKWKLRTKLDNLFYCDKKAKTSYKKLKELWEYSVRYKYTYLVNVMWIDEKIVKNVYNLKENIQLSVSRKKKDNNTDDLY